MEQIKSALGMGERAGTIFEMLMDEHRQVKENLERIINNQNPTSTAFSQTIDALNLHMQGEEMLLYPRLENNATTRRLALKSYEAHNAAKQLINNISSATVDDRMTAKIEVLNDLISKHIDEEENTVFPMARNVIPNNEALEIARQYRSQKTSSM